MRTQALKEEMEELEEAKIIVPTIQCKSSPSFSHYHNRDCHISSSSPSSLQKQSLSQTAQDWCLKSRGPLCSSGSPPCVQWGQLLECPQKYPLAEDQGDYGVLYQRSSACGGHWSGSQQSCRGRQCSLETTPYSHKY